MNSSTSTSVEGVVPSLDIIIGADRLSVDAPGTGWKSVVIDPLVVDMFRRYTMSIAFERSSSRCATANTRCRWAGESHPGRNLIKNRKTTANSSLLKMEDSLLST